MGKDTLKEFEKENTPFKDITRRYFILTGYTEDNMVNDELQVLNLEWMLHKHLQKLGYQRIVFYSRNEKLYCYDEQSVQYLRFGKNFKDLPASSSDRAGNKKIPAGMSGGPLGRRRLHKHSIHSNTNEDLAKQQTQPQNKEIPLHLGKLHDRAIYPQIRSCLMDKNIKTAVIFTNANDFIRNYNTPDMADFFDKFQGSHAENKNIVIFSFPDKTESEIRKSYEHSTGIWKSLFEPSFINREIIRIGLPNVYEIRNLLNYMRLNPEKHLKINVGEIEEISKELLKDAVSNNYSLKYIYHRLDVFIEKNKILCLENVPEILEGKKEKSAMEELEEIIGMNEIKAEIKALANRIKQDIEENQPQNICSSSRLVKMKNNKKHPINMHMVLTGNPGTGKTTIARLLGKIYYEIGLLPSPKVIETDRQGLVAGYEGQTAIKTRDKINEAMGKVLFIDEAYTLYQEEHDNSAGNFGQEAIDTLMKVMEDHRGEFAVIVAGYDLQMQSFLKANDGLAGRFDKKLHIMDYEPEELDKIFRSMAKERGYYIDSALEDALPGFFHNWTDIYRKEPPWSNAREVRKLLDDIDTMWSCSDKPRQYIDGVRHKCLKQEHFPKNCQKNFKKGYRRKTGHEQLEEMIGFTELKEKLRNLYNLKKQGNTIITDSNDEDNIKMHCVLKGNPGTGKTTVARLLGQIYKEMGWLPTGNINEVKSSELMSSIVNKTAAKTRQEAKKALGGILFVDEAYRLHRDDDSNNTGREAIEEIMACMDEYKGRFAVVLAGYPDEMDELLSVNKGLQRRFPDQYVLEDYSASELRQIFELMIDKRHLRLSEEFKEKLPVFFENFLNTQGNDEEKEQWGNAGEVENLIEELIKNHAGKQGEMITEEESQYRLITLEHLPQKLQELVYPVDSSAMWKQLDEMTGLYSVKESIRIIEARMHYQTEKKGAGHYIFKGNPGTGKTTVARLMGKFLRNAGALKRGHVVECTAKKLMDDRKLLDKLVKKAKGGILFIDEAHQLMENSLGLSVLTELVPVLENLKEQLTVICAGYKTGMDAFIEYDPGMPSRFPQQQQLVFEDYTSDELMQILEGMAKQEGYSMSPGYIENSRMVMIGLTRNKTASFGNARDVRNYLESSVGELSLRLRSKYGTKMPSQEELHMLEKTDIARIYKRYIPVSKDRNPQPVKPERLVKRSLLGKQNPEYQTNDNNIENVTDAVVFIQTKEQNGENSYGSGVIISQDGYIITCHHVISEAETVKTRLKIKETVIWCNAEIIKVQEKCDIALLKIEGINYPALALDSKKVSLGQELFLLGYPFGRRLSDDINKLNPSVFKGNVSSINSKNGYERIYVNMEAKSGCSGAPVISNGKVTGILRGSVLDQGEQLTEEFNYIVPAKYIWKYFIETC